MNTYKNQSFTFGPPLKLQGIELDFWDKGSFLSQIGIDKQEENSCLWAELRSNVMSGGWNRTRQAAATAEITGSLCSCTITNKTRNPLS